LMRESLLAKAQPNNKYAQPENIPHINVP
jgi:hypothetical protein